MGKIGYVVVFPTTRNSHFPEKNLLAGCHSLFSEAGARNCYPSGRKYHYIANFPIVRFPGIEGKVLSRVGGVGAGGGIRLQSGSSYNL